MADAEDKRPLERSVSPEHSLILVANASKALKGERMLQQAGIHCALIPLPRSVSQECGVCLQIARLDRERALDALAAAGIQSASVYDLPLEPQGKEQAHA